MKKSFWILIIFLLVLAGLFYAQLSYIWLEFGIDAPYEDFFRIERLSKLAYTIRNIFDLILLGDFNAGLFGLHEDSPLFQPVYKFHELVGTYERMHK